MIGGRSVRARRGVQPATHRTMWSRVGMVPVLGAVYTLGFWLFFVMMHFRSQMWARGKVLEPLTGYWNWFYRTLAPVEQVQAVRRSPEAALHPFMMLAVLALLSGAYLWLLWALRRRKILLDVRALIGLALLASVPLLLLPNLQSGDVYSYIMFGRIGAVHGGNPFITPPSAYRGDPYVQYVNWIGVPSVYGPSWIYLSMILTAVVEAIQSHVIAYVLAYKILAFALHVANGVLIWKILGRLRPQQQQWGTALYLLNPLALIEFAGNAHNDVLMITLILLALWLHLKNQWPWAIIAFTLAVLAKWTALLVLPLYGLVLLWEARSWRERAIRTGVSLALFASWTVLLYSPYWEGTRTLKILVDAPPQKRLINSLGDIASSTIERTLARTGQWPDPAIIDAITIYNSPNASLLMANNAAQQNESDTVWLQQATQYSREKIVIRQQQRQATANREWLNNQIRTIALGILVVTCLVGAAITRSFERAIAVGAWIFFVYCALSSVWFWPWYVTWFVALAALLDWRVTGRTALMFALLSPLVYVFFPPTSDPTWWQRYRALFVFLPPLLLAGWHGMQIVRAHWREWMAQTRRVVAGWTTPTRRRTT